MSTRKGNHVWSKEDNMVALYYYRFGTQHLEMSDSQVANKIGTTLASLKMQAKNFEMLDTGVSGLSDYSQIQQEVFYEFGKVPRYTLFLKVKEHLDLDKFIMDKLLKQKSLNGLRKLVRIES
jgi:hypothetical protein